ncbi:secretion protein HlyD [Phaeovibrio sulfidiphilus]|uniref:Secretion protein HlyD n=1 Tax=Phaeovibrio sulfidiphilus TaxID=1220600 RepID=A0A8J6Z105_9PROT|nr:secretion protein HlyD [Phaeovibrio sulfidiphilus]MBE1237793.1 secretion protein HlyD [Phaeovibrio sulfidiphilus]
MKRKPLVILGAVVVVGLVAGIIGYSVSQDRRNGALTLYGNVDVRQVQLSFRVPGRLVEVVLDEGDAVTPGTRLAQLDPVPYQESLAAAEARLAAARAAYAKARNGPRPAEVEQARARLDQARASLVLSELTRTRQQELVRTKASPQAVLDQAVAQHDASVASLRTATAALDLMEEGTRHEDIEAARAESEAADAALASARTSLSDTTLFAPSTGMIVSRVREPGSIVAAGEPVFVVSLAEPVWVRAYVDEPGLGYVYTGQEVEVFNDTFPDRAYRGVIGFVSPVAEFTPKTVQTPDLRTDLVYRLRVIIQEPDTGLRQGMPVTVRVPRRAPGS